MDKTIGFIGLGLLGLPMATNLLDAGHSLRVYNRTPSKADPLVARGAVLADRPADVVTPGGVVITVVWDDAALESVVTSEGFLERLGPGGLHISMSTVSPDTARRLAALHVDAGCAWLEAPVFGRPEAAAARKLWIPVAGVAAAKDRGRPILEALGGQGIFDFGEAAGAAVTVKLVGNFLIIAAARSLHEGITVAQKSGVDGKALVEMLTSTLFPAPIYQSYGAMAVEGVPMRQSKIPEKDVGLFRHAAETVGAPTPIGDRIHEIVGG
jgi:3-hydroxyisobutyrate dehydrogenase-like beta-hydroxyacid dehydrogenase